MYIIWDINQPDVFDFCKEDYHCLSPLTEFSTQSCCVILLHLNQLRKDFFEGLGHLQNICMALAMSTVISYCRGCIGYHKQCTGFAIDAHSRFQFNPDSTGTWKMGFLEEAFGEITRSWPRLMYMLCPELAALAGAWRQLLYPVVISLMQANQPGRYTPRPIQ